MHLDQNNVARHSRIDNGNYEVLMQGFRPSTTHIDSRILDDKQKKQLQNKYGQRNGQDPMSSAHCSELIDCMLNHAPKHDNGRVARHGWTKLADATNILLTAFGADMTVTSVHLRNRYESLKRSNAPAKTRGRPKKINQAIGEEIRTFVDEENTKTGVTVKELAQHFKVCDRTMQDYIRDQPDLNQRVQSVKIKPRIEWARKANIDHWYDTTSSCPNEELIVACLHYRYTKLFEAMKEFGIIRLDDRDCVCNNDAEIHRICSFDESDINLHKALVKLSGKKVGTRKTQPPAKAGQSTDPTKTTVVAGSKGNGCPLPPMIIFSKATFGDDIAANLPTLPDHEGSKCIQSLSYGNDSGGMTQSLFKDWLKAVIATYTQEALEKGIIILCDGVVTHVLPELGLLVEEWTAKGWKIHLQLRIPYTTAYTQGEDVVTFAILKGGPRGGAFGKAIAQYIQKNGDACLDRAAMLKCLGSALTMALERTRCLSAFRETGILPFNPLVVLENPDFKKLNAHHQDGPSLFEGLKSYLDLPTEPLLTLDPNSTSTQPREAWKEPLTKPEMLARLEAKRKANVERDEKAKKAKATREAKQDAKRDAALRLVDKLNQDTTILISSLTSAELSTLLLFFRQRDTGMKKDDKIARLKDILTHQWNDNALDTPAIAKRTSAIVLKINGTQQTISGATEQF